MTSTVSLPNGSDEIREGVTRFRLFVLAIGGVLALCFVGFLVPDLEYSLADSPVFLGLYALGATCVWIVGVGQRRRLVAVYSTYAILACAAFLAATHYGAPYGPTSPVFMIDRVIPRDDHYLFEYFIRPSLGLREISLFDGFSNAPLHWWANVRVQQLFVAMTGRPQLMAGNALNIVIGSVTAALIVGAVGVAKRPSCQTRFPAGIPIAFVMTCPWLLAASIIAIREVWLYALFAVALYGGLAVSRWTVTSRLVALGAIAAGCAFACTFLRLEMMPMVVALVLIAGMTIRDRPLMTMTEISFVAGMTALTGLVLVPGLALKENSLAGEMQARAASYSALAENPEGGDQGTVRGLVGTGFGPRAVFQTLWMPFQPLPKVSIIPGSTYQLGKLVMPAWIIACLASGSMMARGVKHPEGTVLRRYRWLILWMVTMDVLVGVTSAETRHFYGVLPVACVVLADVFQTRATGPLDVTRAWRKGALLGGAALFLSAMFTLLVFGIDALFPAQ